MDLAAMYVASLIQFYIFLKTIVMQKSSQFNNLLMTCIYLLPHAPLFW
jgi:hypothetical protein